MVKMVKDYIEERLGRPMTDVEINQFNSMFAGTKPTIEQCHAYADGLTRSPLDELKAKEVEKMNKEFEEARKNKQRLEKAQLLEMDEKEKAAQAKKQIAEHLFGETDRHKAIRARWEAIQTELNELKFSGVYIENKQKRVKDLETEREKLKQEYVSTPFVYPAKIFHKVTEYRHDEDMKFVDEGGTLRLKYKNTDVKHTPIYENNIPIALEIAIGNFTLSKMFGSAFFKMRVRIPIGFSPKLETDNSKENTAKSTDTEKKGIVDKLKKKLS